MGTQDALLIPQPSSKFQGLVSATSGGSECQKFTYHQQSVCKQVYLQYVCTRFLRMLDEVIHIQLGLYGGGDPGPANSAPFVAMSGTY